MGDENEGMLTLSRQPFYFLCPEHDQSGAGVSALVRGNELGYRLDPHANVHLHHI